MGDGKTAGVYCPYDCGMSMQVKKNRPVVRFDDSRENPYFCEFRRCMVVDQMNLLHRVQKGLESFSAEEII